MKIRKVFSLFFITMLLCVITACSDTSDNESINKYGSSSASSNGSVIGSGSGFGSDSSSSSDNSDGFESSGDNGSSDDGNNEEEDDELVSIQEVDKDLAYATGYAAYTAVKYCNYKYSSYCNTINTNDILESVKNDVDTIIASGEDDNTYITLFNNAQKMFVKAQNDLVVLYALEDNEKITYSEKTSISDATKAVYDASNQIFLIINYNNSDTDIVRTAYYISLVGYNIYKAIGSADIYSYINTAVSNAVYIIDSLYNE